MDKIIVIVGPTCVGKTKMSVELAKRINGEVINADSTQIYKDNDIATAKVTIDEMDGVKHHLFSIKDLEEDYTVYDYQKDARKCIEMIKSEDKCPILVGGTGLYIKAALYDYKFSYEGYNKKDYSSYTTEQLYDQLLLIDPTSEIHQNNRKRIERALDYYYINNSSLSSKEKTDKLIYDTIIIGLTTDRNNLYDRINNRADEMIRSGLLDEAKRIYISNIRTKAVLTPIGYKELFPYFDGTRTLNDCINMIKQNCRHYAKRQYTWFNHQMNVKWFNVNYDDFDITIDEVMNYIKEAD